MELRVLRYFLACANEQTVSKAAETLHVTQPTLSKQIADLEYELGTTLFERNRKTKRLSLTEAGIRFYDYAMQICDLENKAKKEFSSQENLSKGDIYIGAGETLAMKEISKLAVEIKKSHPNFHYHLYSSDSPVLMEKLERGLIDFALFVEGVNVEKFNVLPLQHADANGVLMLKDNPLAKNDFVTIEDLREIPLLVPQQMIHMSQEAKKEIRMEDFSKLNIVGSFNLMYNASLFVKDGFACALGIDGIIDTGRDSYFVFKRLEPAIYGHWNLCWRRGVELSGAAKVFLEKMKENS